MTQLAGASGPEVCLERDLDSRGESACATGSRLNWDLQDWWRTADTVWRWFTLDSDRDCKLMDKNRGRRGNGERLRGSLASAADTNGLLSQNIFTSYSVNQRFVSTKREVIVRAFSLVTFCKLILFIHYTKSLWNTAKPSAQHPSLIHYKFPF